MTDFAPVKETSDPFWTRVRMALGVLRQEREPAYGQAAIARSIGIKTRLGSRIEGELAAAWTRSGEPKVSLSRLVVELDRFKEYFAAYGRDDADDCLVAVLQAIGAVL